MSLFDSFLSAIVNLLGPFKPLFEKVKDSYEKVTTLWQAAGNLVQSVKDEVEAFKNFKSDLRLKQRVINLETAISKTRDLILGIPTAWRSIVDIVRTFRAQLDAAPKNPAAEAEEAVSEIESGGGLGAILKRFPKLARGLEKLIGAVGIIADGAVTVRHVVDDLQNVVDEVKRLRLEVERADTIFLQQSNARRKILLADGTSMRIRVGKLHQ